MSVDQNLVAGAEQPVAPAAPERAWFRLTRFGRAIARQTVAEPIRNGRLRDLDWPYGLRSIVLIGYVGFGVAAATVILSGVIRQHSNLIVSATGLGLPDQMIWPLVVLLSFGVACCMSAALHGPWWLKILGLLFALMVIGTWSLRRGSLAGWAGWPWIAGALMTGVIILVIIRWRRRFAWWEFAAFWALIGLGMTVGIVETRYAKAFGTDFNPLNLQQTASFLGYLVLPAAALAGASVAEITVRATVSATENAQRLTRRGWPYLILAAVIGVRVAQAGWQIAHRDPVVHGWTALLWAGVLVFAFGVVGVVLLRICRRRDSYPVVSELSDELGRVGFAVAATLLAVSLPVQIFLAVVQVFASLARNGANSTFAYDPAPILDRIIDPSRVAVGLALLVLAVLAARRGQPSRALVLGGIGVVLTMLARQLVFGDRTAAPINQDGVNLVTSALIIVAVGVSLVRRRLTYRRALAFAGVLILCALFSYRDFISDPLGSLLGFSGAALVLFGLTWDLLTDSGWGNRESRRFPRPTRVMLVLTNYVLTMTVLAYAALVRDGSTTIYLEPFAELGNLIFGTGLLAAAVVAVLDSAWRDRPIS
jgi:hypothetical protein